MNVSDVRGVLIRRIKAHTGGRPIIEADQGGEIPDGTHAVYKFIVPYSKGVGRPDITYQDGDTLQQSHKELYNTTLSITAVAENAADATELAQSIRDYLDFYGVDELLSLGISIASLGDVGNRDSVNDDETRRGFDVILRVARALSRDVDYFDNVSISRI